MRVRVRLFAILRERAGLDELEVELPDGATTEDALAALGERDGLSELIERMPLAVAVNRDYATRERPLADGDELALIPPVSGGSGPSPTGDDPIHAAVVEGPISADALSRSVVRPTAGAIVTFQGTTRDVDRLDYEAYREMAEKRIASILAEALGRHGLEAAAAEHRIGAVPLGETSVVVAVSAAHREEAFAGAREAIDRIKAEAPIWKREVTTAADGERGEWVEGTLPAEPTTPPARADR
jgi:molybdopterin synthase catalytic subunit